MAKLRFGAEGRRGGRFRSSFLAGLVVVMPLGLTLWLMWTFAGWVDGVVLPLVPEHLRSERYIGIDLHGIGLVVFQVFTIAVGWFARGWTGQGSSAGPSGWFAAPRLSAPSTSGPSRSQRRC